MACQESCVRTSLWRQIRGLDYRTEVLFYDYECAKEEERRKTLEGKALLDTFALKADFEKEVIEEVRVCTTPIEYLPVSFHAYVVFNSVATVRGVDGDQFYETMWWSVEKTGDHVVLQRSKKESDVKERKKGRNRITPIKTVIKDGARYHLKTFGVLIQNSDTFIRRYSLLKWNCHRFAEAIFTKVAHDLFWKCPKFRPHRMKPSEECDHSRRGSFLRQLSSQYGHVAVCT